MSKLIIGQNDFETWCRHNNRLDLLLEWDYSFNDNLKPCNISFGTAREIGTGHCTKNRAFGILKEELGDKIEQFRTGLVIEF